MHGLFRYVALVFAAAITGSSQPLPANNSANLPAQEIGPDDLIAASVYGSPELSRTVRVGGDGQIRLPMVKQKIQAAGLMPTQLEIEIARVFESEQILVDPIVSVSVVEYRSRPISVAGAVRRPLTFQAFGSVTLLDALTRAEGLNADAGPEILLTRIRKEPGGPSRSFVERIPVKGLIDAAEPQWNIPLTGGEEIRVPEAGKVYVVGNVKKPGAFLIRDSAGTSILRLLALSEGLLPFSNDRAYIYRREAASGSNEISIELKKIVERKAPDVPLAANDILYIPDKKGRRATVGAIEKLLLFGSATSAAAIYAGIR